MSEGGVAGEIGVGTVLGGRYRLEESLGGGGYGQVYAGLDQGLGRRVAVKVLTLRPEWADGERAERQGRFRREAMAAAALSHPNVATIHDTGEHQGRPFIVMELLRGADFRQVLLDRGGLPVPDVLAYGVQICAGLQHAHDKGLIHRDIKPENLMLLPEGVVKICDFGLVAHRDGGATRYTEPQAVMGSPLYFSPEQARGGKVTGQSDLYSLGCVLYALLAEGPPFSAGSYVGYAYLHVHEPPEPIESRRPEVPAELARLVHGLLAKDPRDRPATAGAVAERLRALMRPVQVTPAEVRPAQLEPAQVRPKPAPSVPPLVSVLDEKMRQVLWTMLEAGERHLAAGRFSDADTRYWQALQHITRLGAENEPFAIAAHFGRARVLEGLGGAAAAVRGLAELADTAAAALGAEHPLARCVAAYAEVRSVRGR